MWDWNKFNRLMLQLPAAQESLAVSHFAPDQAVGEDINKWCSLRTVRILSLVLELLVVRTVS